ncbi:serine--pyruvate aminotransferase-like [Tribolium madens]|uniref:serine--pyruvate aminotransferase-like n=1 Tax=Tribolium madens TaxID=41895 RepID=UPI001CF73C39|nr:serine--pyruvate aminotransferase-like [Tribolium madens]
MSKHLDIKCEYKKTAKWFSTPEYLMLTAGPVNISERVAKALSRQPLNPLGADIIQIQDEIKVMLRYLFQTKNNLTLVSQTSGNGGNEAIMVNLLDPGDRIVIAIGGTWGEKMVDMGQRYNFDILSLRKNPGEIFTLEELKDAVVRHKARMLFVTHGESTGGTLQPLEGLGAMCHEHDCLLAVDAIVSIAVEPLFVDRWEIDAVSAGSQKAIGAPPGTCMLSFSPRAEKRMSEKKVPPPYYLDVTRLAVYWKCTPGPRQYHYTFSSNLLASVREALAEICEEGLVEVWERHASTTKLFWKKLEEIGLEPYVKNVQNRFMGVTPVILPPGIDHVEFLNFIRQKFQIDITAGHGPTSGKAIRVGFLGQNSRPEMVEYMTEALKAALEHFKK